MRDCKAARWTRAPLAACIAAAMFGGVAMDVGAAQTGAGNAALGQGEDHVDPPPLGMNDALASAANDLIPPAQKPRRRYDARLESLVNSRKSHEALLAQARAEKMWQVVEGKQVRAVPARQVDAQRARAQRALSKRLSQQKPAYRLNEHGQVVPVDQNELHGAPSHGAGKKADKPRSLEKPVRKMHLDDEFARLGAAMQARDARIDKYAKEARVKSPRRIERDRRPGDNFAKAGFDLQRPSVDHGNGAGVGLGGPGTLRDAHAELAAAPVALWNGQAMPTMSSLRAVQMTLFVLRRCNGTADPRVPHARQLFKEFMEFKEHLATPVQGSFHDIWGDVLELDYRELEFEEGSDISEVIEQAIDNASLDTKRVGSALMALPNPIRFADLPQPERIALVIARSTPDNASEPRYAIAGRVRHTHTDTRLRMLYLDPKENGELDMKAASRYEVGAPPVEMSHVEFVVYRTQAPS